MSAWEGSAWQEAQEQWLERVKRESERLQKAGAKPEIANKAARAGVPIIPALTRSPELDPNPIVAICGECGREIHQVESYACGNARCPVNARCTVPR